MQDAQNSVRTVHYPNNSEHVAPPAIPLLLTNGRAGQGSTDRDWTPTPDRYGGPRRVTTPS